MPLDANFATKMWAVIMFVVILGILTLVLYEMNKIILRAIDRFLELGAKQGKRGDPTGVVSDE